MTDVRPIPTDINKIERKETSPITVKNSFDEITIKTETIKDSSDIDKKIKQGAADKAYNFVSDEKTVFDTIAKFEELVKIDSSKNDDAIVELLKDKDSLDFMGKYKPELLLKAVDVLKTGISDYSREAIVEIFNALPHNEKVQLLEGFLKDEDVKTTRALSEKKVAMAEVGYVKAEILQSAIKFLKQGYYSEKDANSVANIAEAGRKNLQKEIIKEAIENNSSKDDNTIRELSKNTSILNNLNTEEKLKSLYVLSTDWVSRGDKEAMQRILKNVGFNDIDKKQARFMAEVLEDIVLYELECFADKLDILNSKQKTDIVNVFENLNKRDARRAISVINNSDYKYKDEKAYLDEKQWDQVLKKIDKIKNQKFKISFPSEREILLYLQLRQAMGTL